MERVNVKKQLAALDEYLSSDDAPDGSMLLSDLDGFLAGIACSPEPIPESKWMPLVWGVGAAKDPRRHKRAKDWVRDRYDEIFEALAAEPATYEPIFWTNDSHVIAMDYCEGFMEAFKLQFDQWMDFSRTDEGSELMYPIFAHLFDDGGNSIMGIPEDQLGYVMDEASEQISTNVPLIFRRQRIPLPDGSATVH
jgi:uncharacterized protein